MGVQETFVAVVPDSQGGKKIRNISLVVPGQGQVVLQQVVSLADKFGQHHHSFASGVDAFGRTRVSTPETIFDSKQLVDAQPFFWDTKTTGAATIVYDGPNAQSILSVFGGTDSAIRQSRMRMNYQLGKSHLINFTGVCTPQPNVRKRKGYFDGTDGVYFEAVGSGVSWNVMKAGVVTESAPQAQWNLDTLDGNGPSGVALDFTKIQLFIMDFAWLGAGPIRLGFQIGDELIYAHTFSHINANPTVFMRSPNLPIRQEIVSQGGAGSLQTVCSSVMSEGGQEFNGNDVMVDTADTLTTLSAAGTIVPLILLRLKATSPYAVVAPAKVSIISGQNDSVRWSLRFNPTVAGNPLTWTPLANTPYEVAFGTFAAGNTVAESSGEKVEGGYVSAVQRSETVLGTSFRRLGFLIDGTQEVLALCLSGINGNALAGAAIVMRQL